MTPLPALAFHGCVPVPGARVRPCTHTVQEPRPVSHPSLTPADTLSLSPPHASQLDVHLFLFSDVLLVTKPQRKADRAKVIRPPLMLERLVCRPLRDPSTSVVRGPFPSPLLLARGRSSQGGDQIWSSPLADLLLHPDSFLVIHLTEFQCVSSALTVHCPNATDCARWLEKTQQAQVCESRGGGPSEVRNGSTRGRRKRKRLGWVQVQPGSGPPEGDIALTIHKSMKGSLWPATVPVTGRAQDSIP